ncbi:hypothetical protein F2Q69_00011061 [Brassica cretica]|uniref:Uncharacterized protein n=1 Tax=Brassica cretica TaxID=69181 RepID=A0A8S9QNC3_BRACR|nr:hypothetical protein F2Q69_00011061 [Brassica cretica]
MKVTVALLVNVCVDIVDVVERIVDEDLVVSGCVDVVDVTGRELWMELSVVGTKVVIEGEEIPEVVINGGDGSSLGQCVCGYC